MVVGEEGDYYTYRYTHHQNDSCIKMGSDESHFNVSFIVRDKVTRQCPQITILEVKGEPKQIRTEVPLLTSYRLTARPNRLTSLCLKLPSLCSAPQSREALPTDDMTKSSPFHPFSISLSRLQAI